MTLATTLPFADTWGMHGDVGAGWLIVMMAGMVVFIVIAVKALRGRGSPDSHPSPTPETPIARLRRRLADSAIRTEDYEQRRRLLADSEDPADDEESGMTGTAGSHRATRLQ